MDTPMFESWSRGTYEFYDLGCIKYEGVGTLTMINGNIYATKYIEIVDNFCMVCNCLPFSRYTNYNYTKMTMPLSIEHALCKKEYFEQHQMHSMEWPAQGPDLNIIENVSRKMKIELQQVIKA